MRLTAYVTEEDSLFVAQCVEVDVASQGASFDEAVANLREAIELRFEDEALTVRPAVLTPIDVNVPAA